MPLVVMNDALSTAAGSKPQPRPRNGVPTPVTGNMPPFGSEPAPALTTNAPNQYCSTSLTPSPEPRSDRQRYATLGSLQGNEPPCGSYLCVPTAAPEYWYVAFLPASSTRPPSFMYARISNM